MAVCFRRYSIALAMACACLSCVTPAFAAVVSYQYDDHDRLIQETYDNGTRITYTYDEAGNRLSEEVTVGAGTGITLTSPDTGDVWEAGTDKTVRWTYRGNPGTTVKIELLKGGVLNSVVTSGTPIGNGVSGSYTWPIPVGQMPGADYRIKVTSTTSSQYSDASNGDFTIGSAPSVTVVSPVGGEKWAVGQSRKIEWTCEGDAGPTFKIELLKGGALNRVIDAAAPIGLGGSGSYTWTVPSDQAAGDDYRVRVTSGENAAVSDTGNSDFSILSSGITLASPNGLGRYAVGATVSVIWTHFGDLGPLVKVELLKAGVVCSTIADRIQVGGGGYGSYSWVIPMEQAPGDDFRVRVTSSTDSGCTDTSDADFSIAPPSISLSSPYGAVWGVGTNQKISWTYSGNPGSSVKIELLKGGKVDGTIAANVPIGSSSTGSYLWAIPASQAPGNDYRLRITSTTDSACTDTSDYDFSIVPTSIAISSPTGGQIWGAGSIQRVAWSCYGDVGDSVKIELLKGGVLNRAIATGTPAGTGAPATSSGRSLRTRPPEATTVSGSPAPATVSTQIRPTMTSASSQRASGSLLPTEG